MELVSELIIKLVNFSAPSYEQERDREPSRRYPRGAGWSMKTKELQNWSNKNKALTLAASDPIFKELASNGIAEIPAFSTVG